MTGQEMYEFQEAIIESLKSRLSIEVYSVQREYDDPSKYLRIRLMLDGNEISSDYVGISRDHD